MSCVLKSATVYAVNNMFCLLIISLAHVLPFNIKFMCVYIQTSVCMLPFTTNYQYCGGLAHTLPSLMGASSYELIAHELAQLK